MLGFLDGEELLAENFPRVRDPKTYIPQIDSLLVYLQAYPKSSSCVLKVDELKTQIHSLGESDVKQWNGLDFFEKLKRFSVLAEIYGVLVTIQRERKNMMQSGDVQTQANHIKLEALIQEFMQFIENRGWPTFILTQAVDPAYEPDQVLQGWQADLDTGRVQKISGVSDSAVRYILERLLVFGSQNEAYKAKLNQWLAKAMAAQNQRAEVRTDDSGSSLSSKRRELEKNLSVLLDEQQTIQRQLEALEALSDMVDDAAIQEQRARLADLKSAINQLL